MNTVNQIVGFLNGLFFSLPVVFILLGTGVLFTLWTKFGQFKALTHGIAIIRGKYDDKDDPGAINHFQALSAALSATVGLGNIGGVAAAVALGGPGAVFWMWVIGFLGMSLKMTEVTQTMLDRNIDDPKNPHGGPMFVLKKSMTNLMGPTGATVGGILGGVFCVCLILSAITGGNMFQAWNVAEVTTEYVNIDRPIIGVILAVLVGIVIIGGIQRIGSVAGRLVPFMCAIYFLAAIYVVFLNIGDVPAMLSQIVSAGLGLGEASATGAFLGGSFGYAAIFGIKRALFSSEAGQGSAPIAHAAAKCDEPVREGVVAGLEPFIDTIVVCTLTALVIMLSGAFNRGPEGTWQTPLELVNPIKTVVFIDDDNDGKVDVDDDGLPKREIATGRLIRADEESVLVSYVRERGVDTEAVRREILASEIDAASVLLLAEAVGAEIDPSGRYFSVPNLWVPNRGAPPQRNEAASDIEETWRDDVDVFTVVSVPTPDDVEDEDSETRQRDQGNGLVRLYGLVGEVRQDFSDDDETRVETTREVFVAWKPLEAPSGVTPEFVEYRPIDDDEAPGVGLYGDYVGAALTAHAFDRVTPGMGQYLIVVAAWLFALSTMISWSYYGEQGVYFMFGKGAGGAVLVYKLLYCVLVFVSSLPFIKTEAELDMWTTLGLGAMLVANIPIMLVFGYRAMNAYHGYFRRMKDGLDDRHDAPPITDVVEGRETGED